MNPFAPTHPQSGIPRQQKNRPCNRSGQPLTRNFDAIPEYGGLQEAGVFPSPAFAVVFDQGHSS
jgi:hypothetical protein